MTARERFLRIAGLRIHVRESGEGPPVLLINGLGGSTAWWSGMEEGLRDFRVIAFDAPGTGRSQTPLLPPSMPALAYIARQVLDRLGVERADVLGYSLGGAIAQQLAFDAPERVRRLVLVATTCGLGGVPAPLPLVANAATPLRYWSSSFYHRTLPSLAGGRARTDPGFVARHGERRFAHPPTTLGYLWQVVALGWWTSMPRLPHIRHRALVVTGDDDPLMPPVNASILARRLADARLLVVPGEGHLLLMDPEGPAVAPIAEFLATGAWGEARTVGDADVDAALRSTRRRGAEPLTTAGAVLRRSWPAPARPRPSSAGVPSNG